MAIIKSYTDLEQSKKLAGILPITTIDLAWNVFSDGSTRVLPMDDWEVVENAKNGADIIPCWSLAALLDVLPFPVLYMEMVAGMILWCCECHIMETDEVVKIEHYNNSVDACYEMILKLKELNLL